MHANPEIKYGKSNTSEYVSILHKHSNPENTIILALVDSAFMDMTLNFYETSIMKVRVANYLLITLYEAS